MIEWKEIDMNTIFERGKEYLVCHANSGEVTLVHVKNKYLVERDEWTSVKGMTHYAEINLPNDEVVREPNETLASYNKRVYNTREGMKDGKTESKRK